MRRAVLFDWLFSRRPGSVLEIGCGAGALIRELASKGFPAVGVDSSADARRLALEMNGSGARVVDELPPETDQFDYLLSFEVLEHVKDDKAALSAWLRRLAPGGWAFLSVPAHEWRWAADDEAAGHYRRYDRGALRDLVTGAGAEVVEIRNYGWPVTVVSAPLRAWLARRHSVSAEPGDQDARTARSGVDRPIESRLFPLYAGFLGRLLFRLFIAAQRRVYHREWGDGYLVVARKPHGAPGRMEREGASPPRKEPAMKKSKSTEGKERQDAGESYDVEEQPLQPGMQRTREVNARDVPESDEENNRFTPQELGQLDTDRVADVDNPIGMGGLRGPLNQEGQGNRQDDETAELREINPDLGLDDPTKS
jgi:SAM-dependent methyltransferase